MKLNALTQIKNTVLVLVTVIINLLFSACSKSDDSCLNDSIESFKNSPNAKAIVELSFGNEKYYWFVDSSSDSEELVIDQNCILVCKTDCTCPLAHQCSQEILNSPKKELWKK